MEPVIDWSLTSWKDRHKNGYFPNSEQHRNWKVYTHIPTWLESEINPDDVCLEIGCGYGQWMIPLSPMVTTVWGIDIHETPIAVANQKFVEHKVENNCYASVSDGTSIPFPDGSFTLVYSISVFQHLPRVMVDNYIKQMKRVLQPGGRFLHMFRSSENLGHHPQPATDIEVNHTGDFSVGWSEAEILQLGEKHGLNVEVVNSGIFPVMKGKL